MCLVDFRLSWSTCGNKKIGFLPNPPKRYIPDQGLRKSEALTHLFCPLYLVSHDPGAPRFETPLDILAREHPDIHLRVMAGLG
jgi:hypothetical protein